MKLKTVEELIEELSKYKDQGIVVGVKDNLDGWVVYDFGLEIHPIAEPKTLCFTMPFID